MVSAYDLYTATLKRGGGKGKAHEDAGTSKKQASCGEANSTPEQLCRQFKKSLSNDKVAVHFVGSWDTVSSVGVLKGENLPETTNGMKHVCAFRHALALDELRVKFLPEYANGGEGPPPPPQASQSSDTFNPFHNTKSTTQGRKHGGNIKEVWFAGSHSDVGGGIAENLENNSFGPSLRWMTYEAILWGLRMNPFHNKWVLPTSISSMDWRWNVLEVLPISHLSYKNSVAVTRIPHLKSPRQIKPGQRIHESVFELIDRKPKYRPKAKLPEGLNGWKKEHLEAYIEVDPYIQPNKILDAIQGNEEGVDYDGLLNLSKTGKFSVLSQHCTKILTTVDDYLEIGIMAIRERQEAESILATALVNESRKSHSTERNARVATISKILDKCFDIIPVEFLTDENPEPPPSAWAILDTLYPEPSPARSKFLHRFADRNTRLEQTEKEIEKYSKALETGSDASKRVRLGYVKKLVVGLLDLLVLTTPHIDGTYKAALHDLYKKALRFPELSYSDRSALIKSMANGINKNYDIGLEGFLDERISLTKSLFKLTPPENASRDDYLHDLLPTLYQRFEETSQPKDIDEILSFNSEILDLLSASQTHAGAISLACTLASSYMAQFKLTGQFTHVDEALLHLQGGILSSRPSDPDRADLLDIQGVVSIMRSGGKRCRFTT
ncbi:hypothetical protein JR316_0002741 [Psilocybe cubensis]|uniref:T6SS Phospholipase effector Tle1-like catalytic domain-containing protein n=2 Tax=Psilocybe cubensis TaxID=181762 RepID=A0A8H8CQL8_PSICU|nr:hypothetical protein JR316_0002741 [Psilocybe cubensis]KAH9485826.1 hypothetical protein JR316_0002741 [Psilocybe cubensis]